jgi:hypothetical protein
MTPVSNIIKLTIAFNGADYDWDELEVQAQILLAQMKEVDEIETVTRVADPNPPLGNKAIGGIILGLVVAETRMENVQKLFNFLKDRLGSKPIELEVEANGKKLKVSASSRAELEFAINAAKKFVAL